MIYYTLKIRSNIKKDIVEGNSEKYNNNENIYKDNFAESLDNQVVNNRKKDYLYDSILDKLNIFLRIYKDSEDIPVNQPCIGIFDEWSDCSVDCGVGEQYRTFHILQDAGKEGIKCIYGDGQVDKKSCYEGVCEYGDTCDEDEDCSTNYCSPITNKCALENECTTYQLYNCNYNECDKLGGNYHYNTDGNCVDYIKEEKNKSKIYSFEQIGSKILPDEKIGTITTPNKILPFNPIYNMPIEKLGTITTPNNIMPVMPIDNMPIEKLGTITTPGPTLPPTTSKNIQDSINILNNLKSEIFNLKLNSNEPITIILVENNTEYEMKYYCMNNPDNNNNNIYDYTNKTQYTNGDMISFVLKSKEYKILYFNTYQSGVIFGLRTTDGKVSSDPSGKPSGSSGEWTVWNTNNSSDWLVNIDVSGVDGISNAIYMDYIPLIDNSYTSKSDQIMSTKIDPVINDNLDKSYCGKSKYSNQNIIYSDKNIDDTNWTPFWIQNKSAQDIINKYSGKLGNLDVIPQNLISCPGKKNDNGQFADTACGQKLCRQYMNVSAKIPKTFCNWLHTGENEGQSYCWGMDEWEWGNPGPWGENFTNTNYPCNYDSSYDKNANINSCNNKVSEIDNNGSCFKRKKIDVQTSRYISTFSKGEKKVDKNKYCNTILENDKNRLKSCNISCSGEAKYCLYDTGYLSDKNISKCDKKMCVASCSTYDRSPSENSCYVSNDGNVYTMTNYGAIVVRFYDINIDKLCK